MPDARKFSSIFAWLMGFVGLFWVWTVALMVAWPWQKLDTWLPEMRVLAVCANKEACSVPYGDLAAARASGKIVSLVPAEAVGEVQEPDAWLRWRKETGKAWEWEVKRSSWHFEYAIRYRIEGDQPKLVEARAVDSAMLGYALPLALFTVLGLYLRRKGRP
jgi:hypothetical protein